MTHMGAMFHNATSFNQPLNEWDVSSVTHMGAMFHNATSFNQPLNTWDVSSVTDMWSMFEGATSFNGDISSWDVSSATDMGVMFHDATSFNGDISSWDVSSATYMWSMFSGAASFNQPLNTWNVSSVTGMSNMFHGAASFNQPLNTWNVSSVTGMSNMFHGADRFDQDIGDWNVSSVNYMSNMFSGATSFNSDISSWDVSSALDMFQMFANTTSFDQNLGDWYIVIDNTYIDRSDVPGTVGDISALNSILDRQNPIYLIGPGDDSHRFTITDSNRLSMVSATANQTTYMVTITASGDSVFGDGNNRRTIQVTLVGEPSDSLLDAGQPSLIISGPSPTSVVFDGSGGFDALGGAHDVVVFDSGNRTYAIVAAWDDGAIQIMDITNPANPVPVSAAFDGSGGFDALTGASEMAVFDSGDRTYVIVTAYYDDGVQIMDITNPANPVPVSAAFDGSGGFDALGGANDVVVFDSGNRTYAIVAAWDDGAIQIMDITNPANPVPVSAAFDGSVALGALDGANGVEVFGSGDRTYVIVTAINDDGVQIMDITDPANLESTVFDDSVEVDVEPGVNQELADVILGATNSTELASTVFGVGDRTYTVVATLYDNSTQIMDITDPARPVPVSAVFDNSAELGALSFSHDIEVFVVGDRTYAIVAASYDGSVQIMNITNPANPTHTSVVLDGVADLSAVDKEIDVETFVVGDSTYAIVATLYGGGAYIIDITNPANPTHISAVLDGLGDLGDTSIRLDMEVFGVGDRMYVMMAAWPGGGAYIIDITNPTNPSSPTSLVLDDSELRSLLFDPFDVGVFGDEYHTYAIMASATNIDIMNITNPTNPSPIQQEATVGMLGQYILLVPYHMDVFEGEGRTYAMITTLIGGVHIIIDITDPTNQTLVWPVGDLSDTFVPEFITFFADILGAESELSTTPEEFPGFITLFTDVFRSGDRTYAITSLLPTGTSIVDVTDPSNPVPILMGLGLVRDG